MIDVVSPKDRRERAVLIAVAHQQQPMEKTREYLDELEFLASTINIDSVAKFVQNLEKPDTRTFIGSGKVLEIQEFIEANDINVIIFDDELSPSQVRNLENEFSLKIYDRSLLILDIFLFRAQTAQAKTQVELARAQYLLPRLTRMWTHLERQRGGTGTRGGAGEKEIETDRRMIRDKITKLKKQLDKIDKQAHTQRKNRNQLVRVTLVGYTNVGKSTLMTLLSKSDVFAEDKLFATVDSTVRKVVISNIPFLLTDTVGFIRKLPHTLVECFKSTLDEVREADILIHVIDISHPGFEDQIETVNNTLTEIGASDKPTLLVFNKIDNYTVEEVLESEEGDKDEMDEDFEDGVTLEQLKKTYFNKEKHVIFISAQEKENIDELRKKIFDMVSEEHYRIFPNYLKTEYYG